MGRLPPRSTQQVESLLRLFGFRPLRQSGRHNVWVHEERQRAVAVPRNRGSGGIPRGTLIGILKIAGISRAEALEFWGIR